jgi:hypothetical protein
MTATESQGERLDRSLARLRSAFLDQPKSAGAGHAGGPVNHAAVASPANLPSEHVASPRLLGWQFARSLMAWVHWGS